MEMIFTKKVCPSTFEQLDLVEYYVIIAMHNNLTDIVTFIDIYT